MTTTLRETATRSQIGRSQPRRHAREKLRGEAQFVGDLLVPRMRRSSASVVGRRKVCPAPR